METLVGIVGTPVEHPPCSSDLASTLEHELWGQKFSIDTEVKQTTAAALHKRSGNGLLHVCGWGTSRNVYHVKSITLKKKTVPKPKEFSDSE
jgi:hypothetical protein